MSVLEAYRRDPLASPIIRDVNYLALLTALLLYPLLSIPVCGHCELYLVADSTHFQRSYRNVNGVLLTLLPLN